MQLAHTHLADTTFLQYSLAGIEDDANETSGGILGIPGPSPRLHVAKPESSNNVRVPSEIVGARFGIDLELTCGPPCTRTDPREEVHRKM